MKLHEYEPEWRLNELAQDGMISWVDYVYRFSPEYREEFTEFCRERGMAMTNMNALAYLTFRNDLLEEGQKYGDA